MLSHHTYPDYLSYQLMKRVRSCWGRLSQHDIAHIAHDRDRFCKSVTEHYFLPRSRIEHQIREWEQECIGHA